MNSITIDITGLTASGKTTIANIIKEALEDKGFRGVVVFDTYNKLGYKELQNKRIQAIKDNTHVIIETVQAKK